MRKHLLTFIFLAQSLMGFSQFTDNFSDGDFTNNPVWSGDVGNFEVDTAFKLHLNDTIANTSYLSTPSQAIINGIWEFEVKMAFSPSTSNFAKVYLIADKQDLSGNLNGYFVKIGGQSESVDDVSLYVQNGSTETKIIDGTDSLAATNPDFNVKVIRDSLGNWELFLDTSIAFFSEGIVFDNSITSSNYFGVYCKYTSTRADKFWFDNFIISGDSSNYIPQNINANEIVINEIYADPTSSIGLPEYEYIELYNNTNSTIDLTDWTITIGSTEKVFPPSIIEPDSFVILIKESVIDSFSNNISKIGFSSISLTNGGADLILKDNNGKTINAISYTDKWYNDDNKNDGGWSIERVNPSLFCEGINNWRASIANIGGTPGKENSVYGESVYIDDFRITKAYIVDSNKVKIHFNKSLDSLILVDISFFEINGNIPILSNPTAPFYKSTILAFPFSFFTNTTYSIAANNLMDCSGNTISNAVQFGVPDSVLENEIVVNEVLFNPKDNGVDYVELYNNSNSFFDLKSLQIANFEFSEFENKNIANNQKVITDETILFPPKSYLVLTTDTAKVKAQYSCENPYDFIEVESMPTLSNDTGTICIVHQSLNQIIDAFAYSEDMHFTLLETEDGVSLERLDFNSKTQNSSNWHSAASTVGFGTPTYKNSQMYISQSIGEVNVDPKSFTPNNDGNKDICSINWNFSKTNLMATIKIFDSEGRLVKNLINNQMIGNSGNITWDGTSENGFQLNTGMYVIWMEVFSENGSVERFKEVVVLSR
ncbi:MAG: lamin tail domain-containing protein [Flavobacteriales bacterium]|nr:lamin tail domain-containing protein [Flavobacteriales bacterium]